MKKLKNLRINAVILSLATLTWIANAQTKITVDVNKPGHAISPTLFGVFFEDINLSADGGLYPELIRNRSFEDADSLQYWKFTSTEGKCTASVSQANVMSRPPLPPLNPFNRKSVCINANGAFVLANAGYFGMNVVQGNSYTFKVAARSIEGFDASISIQLKETNGKELASGEIKGLSNDWKYYTLNLNASGSDPKAYLEISGKGNGKLFMDMIFLSAINHCCFWEYGKNGAKRKMLEGLG